jgi:amino acid adenylation domain-containing protein
MENVLLTEESASHSATAEHASAGVATSGYRMSPQQRQVWERQRTDGTGAREYCSQLILSLEGDADESSLRAALGVVFSRHESLRTGFVRQPGTRTPLQVIADQETLQWRLEDLRAVDEESRRRMVEEASEAERAGVSAMGQAATQTAVPRAALLRTGERSRMLLLTLPSLCADERSLEVIAAEVRKAYEQLAAGGEEFGLEEPLQYLQFSEWQNELQEDEEAEAGRAYWRAQELTALESPRLPSEAPGFDASADASESSLALQLDPALASELEDVAARQGVAQSSLLQACWESLLWRLGGQDAFALHRPCAGRQYEELGEAVGLFARVLRLRRQVRGGETVSELARRVEAEWLEAESWQEHYPAGEAGEESSAVGFEYVERAVEGEPTTDGVRWHVVNRTCELERARLWLRCECDAEGGLSVLLRYDARAFAAEAATRIGERFLILLRSATENPARRIGELEIMSASELEYVVRELNLTAERFEEQESVAVRFEREAARCASRVAVVGDSEELTYAELNARSNRLAHYLRRLGVGADVPVAVCLGRSARAIVALLGVLKSGGAYLPLDTAYAGERLAFMLEDAGAKVLLTEQQLAGSLPETGARIVCLDTERESIERESADNPSAIATRESLAYVIYTSGSTGRPKGVGVEHRQLLNYIDGVLLRLDLPEGASFATVSTFAADLGHTAIFPSLCTGGCLHVISQERTTDPDALAEYFSRHPVDCLKIVPGHLEALLASPRAALLMPRRRLVLGGEASRPHWVEELRQLAPECRIMNHYGPTETTVGVLTYAASEAHPQHASAATLPLGRPLPNTQVYVLDQHLRPTPQGVTGELYIGGAGVTRGYLGRPELTAERFIPDPFSTEPGARLYRTGDLARHLPGGDIEFLGRSDNQVKIRGFRVELGEIEAALVEHADVREAAVTVSSGATGARLVAYLTARQGHAAPGVEGLQAFLKSKLPEHMIPSSYVLLKSLPLTTNGKLDRRALPEPEAAGMSLERAYVAPRNPLEETLAEVWASVLKLERVGAEDNFFALGGHSLAAMQIMSRVRNTFHVELPLRVVFEATNVAALAEAITAHEAQPGRALKIASALKRLQGMTPEQKRALLEQKGQSADVASA